MPDFMRHDLVWLANDNIPYVVTRQRESGLSILQVARSLGFDKSIFSRKTYAVPCEAIIAHERPLTLKFLLNNLPDTITIYHPDKLNEINQVLEELKDNNLTLRCYGSFSWQFLTGGNYIHNDSDLDILCYLDSLEQLDLLQECLNKLSILIIYPLDGELVFFNRFFIACQEWFDARNQQLLVKTNTEVKLCMRDEIINYLSISG